MRKFIVVLLLSIICATPAIAHEGSQGTPQWSEWKEVTWNDRYVATKHKHFYNRTICKNEKRNGEIERVRLVSNNAGARDCTGVRR